MTEFRDDAAWARAQDAADPLARFRDEFVFPEGVELYFAGHSLGLMPRRAREHVLAELDAWGRRAVEGHHQGERPWLPYHELLAAPIARLTGARPHEVVVMNSLTVNLHLLLVSFYRPTQRRHRIVVEQGAFPSDRYALASQARFHGFPDALVEVPKGEDPARHLDDSTALLLLGSPNFVSGEAFDIAELTRAAHERGCVAGFDLAHGIGNLELALHDWGADFAVWCNYKYLNAGPGGLGGAFVHERHAAADLPRFAGWWGHDKESRFSMPGEFRPIGGAEGWQLSNPPILQLAALRASLELFDAAGIHALREKSVRLTAYLEWLLRGSAEVLTPADPERRGAMLTLRVRRDAARLLAALRARGAVCDARPPDVLRISAPPLYTRFADIQRLATLLREELRRA
ncbi:MAG TPA: kynureninase [Myxococcales bacterium]|nr:kynureninase [Myxococcales bacterium]